MPCTSIVAHGSRIARAAARPHIFSQIPDLPGGSRVLPLAWRTLAGIESGCRLAKRGPHLYGACRIARATLTRHMDIWRQTNGQIGGQAGKRPEPSSPSHRCVTPGGLTTGGGTIPLAPAVAEPIQRDFAVKGALFCGRLFCQLRSISE